MKILVIGHISNSASNGQVAKTKDTINYLEKNGYDVEVFNYGNKGIFAIPGLFSAIRRNDNIILMPGGVKILKTFCFILKFFKHKNVHYLVVGGWILDLLKNNKIKKIFKKLRTIKGIYLQSTSSVEIFKQYGFNNVFYVPTFSNRKIVNESYLEKRFESIEKTHHYNFVFFARVIKEKGIFEACEAIKLLYEENCDVSLDIYGEFYNDEDKQKLSSYLCDFIRYNGAIDGDDVTITLSKYYALLFPTYYKGEGTPHTIIESFYSGLPVIASDWHFNKEIVTENETGLFVVIKDVESLKIQIINLMSNSEKYKYMSKQCLKEAEKFTADVVLREFVKNL